MLILTASPMAVVPELLKLGWLREAVLVLLDLWVMVGSECCLTLMDSGSWNGVTSWSRSSSSLSGQITSSASGEAWRELLVVMPVPIVSTDWAGEPCCEEGDVEDMLMAEGGMATS